MATKRKKKKATETTEAPTRPDVIIPPLPPEIETPPVLLDDGSSYVPIRLIVAEPDPHAPPPPVIEKHPELVVLGPFVPADEQDVGLGLIRLEHSIAIPPITSVISPDTFILARVDPNPGHIGTYHASQWSPWKAGIDGGGPGTYEVRAMMGAEELYREYLVVHPDGRVETKG